MSDFGNATHLPQNVISFMDVSSEYFFKVDVGDMLSSNLTGEIVTGGSKYVWSFERIGNDPLGWVLLVS